MADRFTWTPADGTTTIDLTDEAAGYRVLANGTRGLRSLAWDFTTSKRAGMDGVQVDAVRAEANTPTLGMLLRADDDDTFQARARALVRAMRPRVAGVPTPGILTCTKPSGAVRTLRCYVTAGLEGDESTDVTLPGRWWKFALKLMAADEPWWHGPAVTVGFGLAAPSVFLSTTLPMPRSLSSSSIQGQQVIDLSDADAPSYPVWTITGPGSVLTLTNVTTGRVIQVNATLGDGQTMVIDTRPGRQSVRRGDLQPTDPAWNLGGSLASDPALWPLVEGLNTVTAMLGSAGQNARISGVYRPRYAGI